MVATPKIRDLPASQRARLQAIRDQMFKDAREAVDRYSGPMRARADALMDKVWAARDDPQRVRALCKGFWAQGAQPLADAVSDVVMDAVLYAERYEEALVAYKVANRHHLKDLPRGLDIKAVGDYETHFHLNYGKAGARAAMAYAYRQSENRTKKRGIMAEYERAKKQRHGGQMQSARERLRTFEEAGRAPTLRTEGDRLARKHLRPFKGVDGLSKNLHGTAASEGREMSRAVLRAIREGENAGRAARELQRLVKEEGHKVGGGARRPKLIEELLDAGRALRHSADDPEVIARWEKVQRHIERYQRTALAPGGTVQGAYMELLQDVGSEEFRAKDLQGVVERWGYRKQRYQAERIISSEQATAYRLESMEKQRSHSWIVGYRWEMAAALHNRKMKRRPRRKKLGGKRCICESMAGQVLTPDVAREYPAMGHPHCLCSLIPIYSEEAMMSADITPGEEAWFKANFGD